MFTSKAFTLPFLRKEQIAKETWTFFFDRSVVPSYTFFPGQYTKITLPISVKDGKGSYRFFTTASSPINKEFLEITTRIDSDLSQRSEFKQALFKLQKGQEIEFYGPLGGFYLNNQDFAPRVFISGGIGITPFYSMILYAAEKKLSIPITLIASFSAKEDMIFKEELDQAAEKNKNIRIIFTVSSENSDNKKVLHSLQDNNFEKGRISEELIRKYVKDLQKLIFMISGSPEMIDSTVDMLERMGIEENRIKTDIFTGY